jgi:hypothetical protein
MLVGVVWVGWFLLLWVVCGSVFLVVVVACCLAHLLPAGLLSVEKQIDNFW